VSLASNPTPQRLEDLLNFNTSPAAVAPFGRYVRHLAGADFSLEANTEAAPIEGMFYVLQGGKVLLSTDDFAAAEGRYRELCRRHWESNLGSDDRGVSMASAWGLLGLDLAHAEAGGVIQQHGTAADLKRLTQMRGRALAMKKRAFFANRKAAA
jgi:hypothetical protein